MREGREPQGVNEQHEEPSKRVSRRDFLKLAGVAGAAVGIGGGLGGLVAACGGETTTTTGAPTTAGPNTTASATTVSVAAETQEVLIGIIQPSTGALGSVGVSNTQGALMAIKHINDDGGRVIGGKKIIFKGEAYDDRGDPKQSAAGAQLMVSKGIMCILGPMNGALTLAAQPITEAAKCNIFSYNVATEIIPKTGIKYTFGADQNDDRVPFFGQYYSTEINAKKIVMLTENVLEQVAICDLLRTDWAKRGAEVVGQEVFESGTTDFYTPLTKLKEKGADVLFTAIYPEAGAPIVKQRLEIDWPIQVVGIDTMYSMGSPFFKAAGAAAEGLIEMGWFLDPTVKVEPWVTEKLEIDAAMRDRMKAAMIEAYGPENYAPYQGAHYDYAYAMVDAMTAADSVDDGDKINAALENLDKSYGTFRIKFTPDYHRYVFGRVFIKARVDDPATGAYHGELLAACSPVRPWQPYAGPFANKWDFKINTKVDVQEERKKLGY